MCVAPSIVPEVGRGIAMVTPVPSYYYLGELAGPLTGGSPTRQPEGSPAGASFVFKGTRPVKPKEDSAACAAWLAGLLRPLGGGNTRRRVRAVQEGLKLVTRGSPARLWDSSILRLLVVPFRGIIPAVG